MPVWGIELFARSLLIYCKHFELGKDDCPVQVFTVVAASAAFADSKSTRDACARVRL